ncbi:MAG: glycosyltransferase family 4 protein [Verrucomicrobiota bacterium]
MIRVAIIQEQVPHYRLAFFEKLRALLFEQEIELCLIYSKQKEQRFVAGAPSWATPVPVRKVGPFSLHQVGNALTGVDWVIVPQEIKYLVSYFLLLQSKSSPLRVAMWGHGRSFQGIRGGRAAERLKQWLSRRVDWWFAYNDLSLKIVEELPFPRSKITNVLNSTDTRSLIDELDQLSPSAKDDVRRTLGTTSEQIAVFTGGLYEEKRIEFLLKAAKRIRTKVPDFELLIIGDGVQRELASNAAEEHDWIHYLGKLGDREKVPYWSLAKVLLMPGLVGLVIVDCFALGVPLITTSVDYHSPEIDYLQDEVNGLMVEEARGIDGYVDEVINLLEHEDARQALVRGCKLEQERFSAEAMARRFAEGIQQWMKKS